MTNNQLQVILTGVFGDGSIGVNTYHTNCIHKEYVDFKRDLLGELFSSQAAKINMGYKKAPIFVLSTKASEEILKIKKNTLAQNLELLDDLGVALWFYDDGSLHKTKHFYNLCTHAFSKDEHDVIIPFLENYLGVKVTLRIERKKDGREFYYCSINRLDGAKKIAELLAKFPVDCYKYKYEPALNRRPDGLQFWYQQVVEECVMCGRQKKYKFRVYEAPINPIIFKQYACDTHFI